MLYVYIHIDFAVLLVYDKILKEFLNLYRPFFGHGIFGIYGVFVPQPGIKPRPLAVRAWTGLPGNFIDLFSKSYSEVVIPQSLKGYAPL